MMTVAIRTMPGVDVKSAYESSQHFNTEFDRMRTQDQRGWQAKARRSARATAPSSACGCTTGSAPRSRPCGRGRARPPRHPCADRQATLRETAPGTYTASLEAVHLGRWHLAITATRAGETVFVSQNRIMLKD